ncbi:MAG: hypothetical protein ABII88_05010 [Candidatus Omnitrophota bacterium]
MTYDKSQTSSCQAGIFTITIIQKERISLRQGKHPGFIRVLKIS